MPLTDLKYPYLMSTLWIKFIWSKAFIANFCPFALLSLFFRIFL
ncbi:MAG: hypothetical protein BSOLF_2811 [Candidatus Carbobacillus altaicus]|uniref:Uncharacterized protein n=1 Tax=Candidatus Carbonibacillus altaicus TaxID=2163959 RepID=A0A2R6Y1X5_9BACL|nr:MAG: hypothetical protein BSOLF_2811 [Candidatus Carbobacillus altaicus]